MEEKKYKSYEERRAHFIERLAERYGIDITNEEYDNILRTMSESERRPIYKLGASNLIWVEIQGQWVLCIYRPKKRHDDRPSLVTALLIDNEFAVPCPMVLRRNPHYDVNGFEQEMNEIIEQAYALGDELGRMGKKEFFVSHPADYRMKGIAYMTRKHGIPDIGAVAHYIIKKHNSRRNKISENESRD